MAELEPRTKHHEPKAENIEQIDQTDQFILNLFPQVFEALVTHDPIRDHLLKSIYIMDPELEGIMFKAQLFSDKDVFQAQYGTQGKEDKTFTLATNPREVGGKSTFDAIFTMTHSRNGYFVDPVTGHQIAISALSWNEDGSLAKASNNFEACVAGLEALKVLTESKDGEAVFLDE